MLLQRITRILAYVKAKGPRQAAVKACQKSGLARVIPQTLRRAVDAGKTGVLTYRCNICGNIARTKVVALKREEASCSSCGSTVRMRAIVRLLSLELFGESLALLDFPERPDITGMGMSDWEEYARPLSRKLNYTNTFYHQEPKLDITSIDPRLEGTLDFLISSDVFEHVEPPVSRAFQNARRLLKPGGVFVFTVPYAKSGCTVEHFPELHLYDILKHDETYLLRNRTKDGREQCFDNLVFHGGPGATLEMRVFSESSLKDEFAGAEFYDVRICDEPDFDHGIYWSQDCSLPIVARIT